MTVSRGLLLALLTLVSQAYTCHAYLTGSSDTLHVPRLQPWSLRRHPPFACGAIRRSGIEDIDADAITTSTVRAKGKPKRKQKQAAISPAIAEWAAASSSSGDSNTTPSSGTNKGYGSSSRRQKQAERQAVDEERAARIQELRTQLQTTLESKKPSLQDILQPIRGMTSLASTNTPADLRALVASPKSLHYRLAWVGGDDAICHTGTGLHKVPLARLQEVFLTLHRSRITWSEVIRIVGPFPNVKNELKGNTQVANPKRSRGDATSVAEWNIAWDSMVDGTGREVTAGPEVRNVVLQVLFADPEAIVAVVPDETGAPRADPFQEDGKHVLVLVKEEALDDKLEALRVA